MNIEHIMTSLAAKHPGESEYLQAVHEVLLSIEEVYNQHPEFEKAKLIERLVEPDRIITFKVPWVDDNGEIQVNLGYRVQFNNAIQRRNKIPCIGKSFHIEIPRIRTNIQKCTDHSTYGWWKRWFGFQPSW